MKRITDINNIKIKEEDFENCETYYVGDTKDNYFHLVKDPYNNNMLRYVLHCVITKRNKKKEISVGFISVEGCKYYMEQFIKQNDLLQ